MRRRVWVAKDSPRITAGELQRLVESWGQKPKKKKIKHPLYHHMLFGRVSRKIVLTHPKTNSSKFSCQTRLELQNGTGFYCQMKLKKIAFWQQTHQMSLVQTGIKKYPMSTVKYTAGYLMLWACFSAGGPEHLVQKHGIMDSIKYQQIKNQNLTASVRNLIMGRVWIFHQDNNPKQTSK